MRCGLLGEKLGHSYSPELHAFFGNYDYELFEVPPDQLGDFIRARDFQGLNVTIPYKTTMLAICDDLTEAAAAIGSVNTVVKQLDGSLLGDNTDAARLFKAAWHAYGGTSDFLHHAGCTARSRRAARRDRKSVV